MGKFVRKSVSSQMVASVSHDAFNDTLEVVFCHGGIYEYSKITAEEFSKMQLARSLGEYFNKHIRNQHQCRKVRD